MYYMKYLLDFAPEGSPGMERFLRKETKFITDRDVRMLLSITLEMFPVYDGS